MQDHVSDSFQKAIVGVDLQPINPNDIELVNNRHISLNVRFGRVDKIDVSPYLQLIRNLEGNDYSSFDQLEAEINTIVADPRIAVSVEELGSDSFQTSRVRVTLSEQKPDMELINNSEVNITVRFGETDKIDVSQYLLDIEKLQDKNYNTIKELENDVKEIVTGPRIDINVQEIDTYAVEQRQIKVELKTSVPDTELVNK